VIPVVTARREGHLLVLDECVYCGRRHGVPSRGLAMAVFAEARLKVELESELELPHSVARDAYFNTRRARME
jgi:hypothetical protein